MTIAASPDGAAEVQFITTFWNHGLAIVDLERGQHSSWRKSTKSELAMSTNQPFLSEGQTIFPTALLDAAAAALDAARRKGVRVATAETVTAGLVSACLTSVSGASQIFDRAYVLYHESAKATGLGVAEQVSAKHGAVSAEVTQGLAEGLLSNSGAAVTVAITGYAGPGGGNAKNPVGTIFIAAARKDAPLLAERHVFAGGRDNVRLEAVAAAIRLLHQQIDA
jgi:nicotinamide-nucleotide amidase